MANPKFKCIKGSYEEGQPAHIYFYSDVNSWRVDDFIYEFKYLMNYVNPSEINVHINSGGGNCVDGISVFSLIQDCKIPTNTINDGIAASMGSVIWAAGDKQYMRDYAILMIHNPFADAKDKATQQAVDAFKKTLSIIYQKRFGLNEEQVTAIMDGKKDEDGTWMSASEAVKNGFISQSHVIETPQAVKDKIAASIKDIMEPQNICAEIGKVMNEVSGKTKDGFLVFNQNAEGDGKNKDVFFVFNQNADNLTNNSQDSINQQNITKMNEQFTVVAALLGLAGTEATQDKVSANIKSLLDIKGKYESVTAELTELKTKLTGSEAAVANLTKNLNETKAALKVYQDAEAAAKTAQIEALVEEAIKACKIEKDAKESWISMAQANFDLAKATLDSIPAREDIAAHIANDPDNKDNAGQAPKTPLEKEIEAKVQASVGADFKFMKPTF